MRFKVLENLTIRNKIIAAFSVLLVVISVISFISYQNILKQSDTAKWVEHTHQVITDGREILKLLIDMETGERGFLITGNDLFLAPFNNAQSPWQNKLSNLMLLVADNPKQVQRLGKIIRLQQQWLDEAATVEISTRRQLNTNANITMKKCYCVNRKSNRKKYHRPNSLNQR